MEREYEQEASEFCEAIRIFAEKPKNLDNLEDYLSIHFGAWLKRYANSPENVAAEMFSFATM